ncbi:MAG: hypothetical protein ABIO72_01095 [Patescibacteria group bacterium]
MKRVLFVLLAMLLAAGIAASWWVLRDSPEKALRDGLLRLTTMKTAETLVLDVAWTSPSTRITTGLGFAGQIDLTDQAHPRIIGVIRAGEGLIGPEQTADIIVDAGRLALRPHTVTVSSQNAFVKLAGVTSSDAFALLDISSVAKSKGVTELSGLGHATETQAVLTAFPSLIQLAGDWIVEPNTNGKIVTIPFQLDRTQLRPFFIAFYTAQTGKGPDANALRGIDQANEYLLHGTYLLTVDRRTRQPITLQAAWPILNPKNNETLRIRVRLDIAGINKPVAISIPTDAVDITNKLLKPIVTGLPSAAESTNAVVVPYQASTSSKNNDRFNTYIEDLGAKHDVFMP